MTRSGSSRGTPARGGAARKRRAVLCAALVLASAVASVAVAGASGETSESTGGDWAQGQENGSDALRVDVRQITRPEFPDVNVYASVRDAEGDPVTGLTADDFSVAENGSEQAIESVEPVRTAGDANVSVSLVIDRSGSMSGEKIGDARAAADQFVTQLGAGDEAEVIAFSDTIEYRQRWTTDAERLSSAIDGITTGGETAVWRATREAVNESEQRVGRSAVVVLTDGQNNAPPHDVETAIDRAQAAGVPVYAIGLGPSVAEGELKRLAEATGGSYYESPTSDDLAEIYDRIGRSITTEYEITYRTDDPETDGTNRTVELTAMEGGNAGSDAAVYEAPCAPLPDAAFEVDPGDPSEGQQVTFDAGPSSANGGEIASYRWDFDNDGVADAVGETAAHAYEENGTYQARLTVEKGCGASDVAIQEVEVSPGDGTAEPVVVDDFEDRDLAEYDVLAGSGSDWEVTTANASEGDAALQYQGSDGPAEITSLGGLPAYPAKGDVFRFDFGTYGDWDFRTSFNFGQQPDSGFHDRYELEFEPRTDTVRLQLDRPDQEEDETLGTLSVDFERNAFYTAEVDWASSSDDIQVRIYEAPVENGSEPLGTLRVDEPDDAPTGGGIGVFANGEGDRWVYDNVRLLNASGDRGGSLFEIVAGEEGAIEYEIIVNGTASKTTVSERVKAEENDAIHRVTNRTTVIEGFTGNTGYGDAYRIDGEIIDFARIAGDVNVTITLDGEETSPDELSDDPTAREPPLPQSVSVRP